MAQRLFQTLAVLVGLAVLAALPLPALAQDGAGYPEYSGSYALLIGVGKYDDDFWDPSALPNVQRYLEDMKEALTSQGFRDGDVEIVEDPKNTELREAIRKFLMTHGRWSDNRLLIYFMGHGHTLAENPRNPGINEKELGYLVSRDDVPVNSRRGESKFRTEAVPMSEVWNWAYKYKAKHTLIILDACFSGHAIPPDSLDDKDDTEESLWPSDPEPESVVQVVTAGNAFQKVPAKSMFTELLLDAITMARTGTDADKNLDGLLTGTELGNFLYWKVARASGGGQTPFTSTTGEGEFVFRVPRDN